jgi:hypothetical protein
LVQLLLSNLQHRLLSQGGTGESIMVVRSLIAAACVVLLIAHLTGGMKTLFEMLDLGLELRDMPYLLALPFTCIFTLVMLRN